MRVFATAALLSLALHAADASSADERSRRPAQDGSPATGLNKPTSLPSRSEASSLVAVDGSNGQSLWIDITRVVQFPPAGEAGNPVLRAAQPGEAVLPGKPVQADRAGKAAGTAAPNSTSLKTSPNIPPSSPTVASAPRVSPVFVDAGGNPRALAGGVIVSLKEALASEQARARLEGAGLTPVRQIGERMWLVESPVGVASLELANRLADTGQFEFVQPNWWQPRTTK